MPSDSKSPASAAESTGPVLNISWYRFVPLADPAAWRTWVFELAQGLGLKGTVLLAEEGINLFVAGPVAAVEAFVDALGARPECAGLDPKRSASQQVPFRKLLVKVKREIIRMNHPAVVPAAGRAPAVDAGTLRRWLDQGHDDTGRPVVTLDTRNAFEVDHGRFQGAIDWRILKFSDFGSALEARAADLAGKTVVSYCTGGIRCEKAAILMQQRGIERVYQLEGGILRYFELEGGAHFEGDCFVFDGREALDPGLRPQMAG